MIGAALLEWGTLAVFVFGLVLTWFDHIGPGGL